MTGVLGQRANMIDRVDGIPEGLFKLAVSHDERRGIFFAPHSSKAPFNTATIQIWNLQNKRVEHTLCELSQPVGVLSPDDSLLALQGGAGQQDACTTGCS